ncbi:hypothetical protein GCM10010172_83650 [Paractinoplanes ferrugineus]|uniref:RNA polymerase sigma-70 factor (ECF subfamily) n=1 Tax=Paractinoplanes ferrugineus TaxID=113564 RepID=A0A919J4Z2_9ACTN|nr:RNA polymerase sigma factor [Actinoplanes ferrugineus]GIE10686.1 hypothetical protein Afe05nite_25260 [Actinoplanes ferrugineus]
MSVPVHADDVRLRALLVAADENALIEAFDRHAPAAYALAARITGDPAHAEDAVQEAFVELWRHPERFDPRIGPMRSWLCVLARRRAIDLLRRRPVRRAYRTGLAGSAPARSAPARSAPAGSAPARSAPAGSAPARSAPAVSPPAGLVPVGPIGPVPVGAEGAGDVPGAAQAAAVRACVRDLPPLCADVIALAYYYGLSHRQVAVELGVSEDTARSGLRNGLRLLAERMTAAGY